MCLGYLKWVCLGILQYGQLKTHTVQTELLTIKWLGEVLTSSSNGVNLLQFRTSCPGWTSSALPTMATWCRTSCLSWWSCSSTTTMTTSLSSGWHSTRSNSTLIFLNRTMNQVINETFYTGNLGPSLDRYPRVCNKTLTLVRKTTEEVKPQYYKDLSPHWTFK